MAKVVQVALAVIGGMVLVGSLLDLLVRGGTGLRGLYRGTIGLKAARNETLSRLAPGVQVGYFEAVLGSPIFRTAGQSHDESVWLDRFFYVQTLSTKEGRVDLYTVTARSREFSPSLWGQTVYWSLDNNSADLRIGGFTFDGFPMKERPDGILAWLGARRFHWAECYYFGNPGLYQTYFVALNDAGWMEPLTVDLLSVLGPDGVALGWFRGSFQGEDLDGFLADSAVVNFRKTWRPNTYGVLGAHLGAQQVRVTRIGADLDQVRTVPR